MGQGELSTEARLGGPLLAFRPIGFALRLLWSIMLVLAVIAPGAGLYYRGLEVEAQQRPFDRAGLSFDVTDGILRLSQPRNEAGARRFGRERLPTREAGRVAERFDPIFPGDEGAGDTTRSGTRRPPNVAIAPPEPAAESPSDEPYRGRGLDPAADRAIEGYFGIVPALLLVGAASLLFRRGPREPTPTLLSLSLLMLSASAFLASHFWIGIGLIQAGDIVLVLGWLGVMLALLTLPDGRFRYRWTRWLALALIPFALIAFFRLLPREVETLVWFGLFGLSVLAVHRRYRDTLSVVERQQIKWVLFGFAAGFILLALSAFAFVLLNFDAVPIPRPWLRAVALLFAVSGFSTFTFGLLVALLKWRLYDADAVISRSAVFGIVAVVLAATGAVATKGLEFAFEFGAGEETGAWPVLAATSLSALLIRPATDKARHWADVHFRQRLTRLRQDLPRFLREVRGIDSTDALLGHILHRVELALPASRAAVLVAGKIAVAGSVSPDEVAAWRKRTGLELRTPCEKADRLFPFRIPLKLDERAEDGAIGWMLLGPRPDGTLLGRDEVRALEAVAAPIAAGLLAARSREAREQRDEARFANLEAMVAEILSMSRKGSRGRKTARR